MNCLFQPALKRFSIHPVRHLSANNAHVKTLTAIYKAIVFSYHQYLVGWLILWVRNISAVHDKHSKQFRILGNCIIKS